MQGYDKEAAVKYFMQNLRLERFKGFSQQMIEGILREAIHYDMEYMNAAGVLKDGMAADVYYDDDDAFEFIVDAVIRVRAPDEEEELLIASLIEEYMDLQQNYLEQNNMIEWD